MRALLPHPADDVDPLVAYAPRVDGAGGRAFVRCNMISTLDGAISLNGRSGMLGGPADRRVFQALRSLADVVLVGAGTARTEGYGPVRLDDRLRAGRERRGQPPVPPVALVTRSAVLDWSAPFFVDAEQRPFVFTTGGSLSAARADAAGVADVIVAGDDHVDMGRVVTELFARGLRSILLEGGPRINAEFVEAGLLDELCLTLAPRLAGGSGQRVLAGPELVPPLDLDIVHLLEEEGFLFYRLSIRRPS
jgi:riboflavin biosynthesis pyrimidine reductase